MSRLVKIASVFSFFCLVATQRAQALPPPTVIFSEASTLPATRLFSPLEMPPPAYGPTAHNGDDTFTSALGYNFVTYWDSFNRLCLARRPVGGGAWVKMTFTTTLLPEPNAHRSPNVAVSPVDGRLHLAYGMHNTTLRYRMSVSANAATVPDASWLPSLFQAERSSFSVGGEVLTQVTYPNFVCREINNQLVMFWQDNFLKEYSVTYNNNGTWGTKRGALDGTNGTGTYVDPTGVYGNSFSRVPYRGIATFGNDIHYSWTWKESNPNQIFKEHDLMYAKSTDGAVSWKNTAGSTVTSPMVLDTVSNPNGTKVWDINYDWLLFNAVSPATDSQGNTHVALFHRQNGASSPLDYCHYVRTGTTWTRTMLAALPSISDGLPKIFVDRTHDTAYMAAIVGGVIKVYAAQKAAIGGQTYWDTWGLRYTGTQPYIMLGRGQLSSDGTTLWLLAQRPGALQSSTSSPMDLVKLTLVASP